MEPRTHPERSCEAKRAEEERKSASDDAESAPEARRSERSESEVKGGLPPSKHATRVPEGTVADIRATPSAAGPDVGLDGLSTGLGGLGMVCRRLGEHFGGI